MALVAGVVQAMKKYFGTNQTGTMVALAAVSFRAAGVMYALQVAGLWDTIVKIAVSAAGIYALLIKPFESD